MDSYNFTYKDVLKRYERIINKPSKFEIRLLASILLIITIVNITSLCFAAETEEVSAIPIEGLVINPSGNYFISSANGSLGYVELEKGYIYTITNTSSANFYFAFSNELPALNGIYYDKGNLNSEGSYTFISDNTYLYFDYSWYNPSVITITREKISSQEIAVNDLVENVGISQIWDIFDTSIGYIVIVVVAAFGIFLVVIAIRKMQKGKSEF